MPGFKMRRCCCIENKSWWPYKDKGEGIKMKIQKDVINPYQLITDDESRGKSYSGYFLFVKCNALQACDV